MVNKSDLKLPETSQEHTNLNLGDSGNGSIYDELGYIIQHCCDLPALQTSKLVRMPVVAQQALNEEQGLELAKALRKELIACAEQITQRRRLPIDDIMQAIQQHKLDFDHQDLAKIKKGLGVPFPRHMVDLARYYAIQLVIQGVSRQEIAEFLEVDVRTVANYIAQAKARIKLILETKSKQVQPEYPRA